MWDQEQGVLIQPPFPVTDSCVTPELDVATLRAMLGQDYLVGFILVRLGAFAVGIAVTILAALAPALRASRRAPVDAMRSASAGARTVISTARLTVGMLVGGLSASLLIGTGLERGSLVTFAVGAAALTLAVILLSPLVAGPLPEMIGMPVRALRRLPGLLAGADAVRNAGRTAATAAALAAAGQTIGPHDLWLAATCLAYGFTMVTANVREFARVPGLAVEVWSHTL